jgi:4-amino-4-deoxy-L-arabinose transferase-like glycosyltransferase
MTHDVSAGLASPELADDRKLEVDTAVPSTQPVISAWLPSEDKRNEEVKQSRMMPGGRAGKVWRQRGVWLGLVAIAISFGFTLLLAQGEPIRTVASIGLIIAGLVATVAWGRTPSLCTFARSAPWWPFERVTVELGLRLVGILLSILLIWLANSQFQQHIYETFGLAGWLWLASMALLVISTAGWPRPGEAGVLGFLGRGRGSRSTGDAQSPALPAMDRAAAPQAPIANTTLPTRSSRSARAADDAGKQEKEQPRWRPWEVGVFVGIVTLAVAVRTWDLADVPFAIHPDEIITGRTATQAFINPSSTSIFQTVWFGIDLPALWFMLVAQVLKLGGSTLVALRLPAALFGAAAVVPFYFLLRSAWGRATAIVGAATMAFGIASVHFARVTVNNIVTPFFWCACFFFILRALRRGRPVDWVLAGIFGGLSEHFYYGTRLLGVILIVFALYLLVVHWRRAKYLIPSFMLVVAGYMAAFGPLFSWFQLHPQLYWGLKQGAKPLTWNHFPVSLDDVVNMWNTLWPIFARNLLTISTLPATDSFYFSTMLMPIEAALLVLGVALLVWRWRQPVCFLLLISGFGVLIAGGTLVPDAGNLNHWTPAFPAFYAAVALPVSGLAWAIGRVQSFRLQYLAPGLLGAAIVLLGFLNISYYFTQYHSYRADMEIPGGKARFQAQLGVGYQERSVGRTWQLYDPEFTGYVIKGIDGGQIWNPASELPLPYVPGRGQVFTFFNDQVQYINPLQIIYPGGKRGQMLSQGGVLLFDYYAVPADVAESDYGADVQLIYPATPGSGSWEQVDQVGALPASVHFPVRARWTALLYLASFGPIGLTVPGTTASILVDGQSYGASATRAFQPGWHQLSGEASLTGPSQVKLMLSESGGEPVEVPRERLWATRPGTGLLASVSPSDPAQSPLVRYEQYIGFTDLINAGAFGPQIGAGYPLKVRWVGQLHISVPGKYQLEVRSNGDSRLLVDGQKVVATCAGTDPFSVTADVDMTPGWHPVQLEYMAAGTANTLELYWTTPDGARSMIPPTALRFAPETSDSPTQAPAPPDNVDCQAP